MVREIGQLPSQGARTAGSRRISLTIRTRRMESFPFRWCVSSYSILLTIQASWMGSFRFRWCVSSYSILLTIQASWMESGGRGEWISRPIVFTIQAS